MQHEPRTQLTRGAHGRAAQQTNDNSALFAVISGIATLGVFAYAIFLLNPANRGDFLPYVLVITAESILVFHAVLSMWTIMSSSYEPRDFRYHEAQRDLLPFARRGDEAMYLRRLPIVVDVFVTVYGEDLEVVRRTVVATIQLKGAHRTWVLDDGRSDVVRDMAASVGARYVRRLSTTGAKAGNLNHALTLAKGDYFAVFDADFVPRPEFLLETVPFFVDVNVAFVQTPQAYGNLHTAISRGAAYMQTMFYRFAQRGRNRFNAAFCVGTNVIFRRAAIDEIGGIYSDSKSEDVWTALLLHERGWRSIYIPDVLAIGDAPETIEAYSKQQLRWATGGFEILLTHNPLSPRRRLNADQRIQYFVTATFYLTGIAPLLLLLVPPLEIYFDLRPMDTDITPLTWAFYYAGFYVMQVFLAWFVVGSFRWETLTLSTVSFPIYAKALWNAITGKDQGWHVTGSASRRSPFNFIVPQVVFFVFLALTSVVGIWRDAGNGSLSLATAWNVTNTLILAAFIGTAVGEYRTARVAVSPARRTALAPTAVAGPLAPAPLALRNTDLAAPLMPVSRASATLDSAPQMLRTRTQRSTSVPRHDVAVLTPPTGAGR